MSDLFASVREERRRRTAPLADRMRPRTLDEVVGQSDLLDPGAAFRTMVEQGRLVSIILFGPPGTGKTTLARLVASETRAAFEQLTASSHGVKDVRQVLARAERRWRPRRRDGRFCSSTRSTASTRHSRTHCSRAWRTGP